MFCVISCKNLFKIEEAICFIRNTTEQLRFVSSRCFIVQYDAQRGGRGGVDQCGSCLQGVGLAIQRPHSDHQLTLSNISLTPQPY